MYFFRHYELTINLDQNVDFLFTGGVLSHQCVLASVIAVNLIDNECSGGFGDIDEAAVMEVHTRLGPGDGGGGTSSDVYEEAEGAASTQADGLLKVIVELQVRSFWERIN